MELPLNALVKMCIAGQYKGVKAGDGLLQIDWEGCKISMADELYIIQRGTM